MQSIYVFEIYYDMLENENQVYSIYISFTGVLKKVPLYYGLCKKQLRRNIKILYYFKHIEIDMNN